MKLEKLTLTMREVAEETSCCERSVWAWIKSGELKSCKLGRSVRVMRDDLKQFLRDKQA